MLEWLARGQVTHQCHRYSIVFVLDRDRRVGDDGHVTVTRAASNKRRKRRRLGYLWFLWFANHFNTPCAHLAGLGVVLSNPPAATSLAGRGWTHT